MSRDRQRLAKIATITSLAELDGYEAEAKKRGLSADEMKALADLRERLTKRRRV